MQLISFTRLAGGLKAVANAIQQLTLAMPACMAWKKI